MAKLGILAGGGELPGKVADHCRLIEKPCFIVGFEGHAEHSLSEKSHYISIRLGEAGKAIKYLKQEGVEELIFVGSVSRPTLNNLRPDMWTARFLARVAFSKLGDDGLLRALATALEQEGFKVIGAHEVLPELLMPEGCLTPVKPDIAQQEDIKIGIAAAKALGQADKGQAVIVYEGQVVDEEDTKGTDALIKRNDAGILVKVKKPQQDERLDLPTIGPETIENIVFSGLSGVAVEAGKALLLDKEETIERAKRTGTFIVGCAD